MLFRSMATATGTDASAALADFSADVVASAAGEALVLANATYIAAISEGVLGVDVVMARLLWEVINNSQTTTWTTVKTQS